MAATVDTLTAPFRGDALAVNITFGLLLGPLLFFMQHAGFFALYGLPALIILVPWFLKYCLVVGQAAAYGRREPPALSMKNLNPLELAPIALTLGLLIVHHLLAAVAGPAAGQIGVALIAPAAIAVLIIEERVVSVLNPLLVLAYARGLGRAYPAFALLLGGGLFLCGRSLGSGLGTFATVFLLQSILIGTFHGAGRLLLAREEQIGYTRPETPDERAARARERARRKALDATLDEAYEFAEAGKPERALETVLDHLRRAGDAPELYATVLEPMLAWPDPTVGLAVARHYVDCLLRGGDAAHATQEFLRAYDLDNAVRPIGPEATLRIARLARERGRSDAALAVLEDFDERFPESELRPLALLERARLLFEERDDAHAALHLLERLESRHPEAMSRSDVRKLRAGLGSALPDT